MCQTHAPVVTAEIKPIILNPKTKKKKKNIILQKSTNLGHFCLSKYSASNWFYTVRLTLYVSWRNKLHCYKRRSHDVTM
jgi:hypothetical protein